MRLCHNACGAKILVAIVIMTVDIFEIKSGTNVAVRASTILDEKRVTKAKKPREEVFRVDLGQSYYTIARHCDQFDDIQIHCCKI